LAALTETGSILRVRRLRRRAIINGSDGCDGGIHRMVRSTAAWPAVRGRSSRKCTASLNSVNELC